MGKTCLLYDAARSLVGVGTCSGPITCKLSQTSLSTCISFCGFNMISWWNFFLWLNNALMIQADAFLMPVLFVIVYINILMTVNFFPSPFRESFGDCCVVGLIIADV